MEYEKLKNIAKKITMPEDMKDRIVKNCTAQILNTRKEMIMEYNKKNTFFRKPVITFAVLAICLSLSVSALAITAVNKGFFRDITNFYGAVIGTSYEQASDEIGINVIVNGNELTVLATIADPQMIPYSASEKLGIVLYQIVDTDGKIVAEGATEESGKIVNGQAVCKIYLDSVDNGDYKLVVTALVAEKESRSTFKAQWQLGVYVY